MAWRKADNWTAFTNGYLTWINGPTGLVNRLNTDRFSWEAPAILTNPEGAVQVVTPDNPKSATGESGTKYNLLYTFPNPADVKIVADLSVVGANAGNNQYGGLMIGRFKSNDYEFLDIYTGGRGWGVRQVNPQGTTVFISTLPGTSGTSGVLEITLDKSGQHATVGVQGGAKMQFDLPRPALPDGLGPRVSIYSTSPATTTTIRSLQVSSS